MRKEQLTRFIDRVIAQGEVVKGQASLGGNRDLTSTYWFPRVMSVFHLLGSRADPWKSAVAKCPADNSPGSTDKLLAVLKAIREAVDEGLLEEIENSAHAEAYNALLGQAEQLAEVGLCVAAGSVAQTVLQEHLWEWCQETSCLPNGDHPSVEHLARALYLRGQVTLANVEAVNSISRIGEHCRHNGQPPMPADEVRAAIAGVREFITGHPLR
jgi:hypothetical protein